MIQEKLYGQYPGSLSIHVQNKIQVMSEEEIFKLIYYIEGEVFWSQHEDRNYTSDFIELEEKTFALDFVIYSTRKFGINFNPPSTKRLEKKEEYLNWYKKWNNRLLKQTLIKKNKKIAKAINLHKDY